MENGKGFVPTLYKIYLPLAIPYMIIEIWELVRHFAHFVTEWWFPFILIGLLAVFAVIRWRKRKTTPIRQWEKALGLGLCVAMLGFSGCSGYREFQVPAVHWTRITARTQLQPHQEFLDEMRKGMVRLESLMTPPDRKELLALRKNTRYQENNDALLGANFRIFESNPLSRCPTAIKVRDPKSLRVGVYVIRDGQPPNQRLASVGERVTLPRFPDDHSEFRLVVVLFALNQEIDQKMEQDDFDPNTLLNIEWRE